MFARTPSRSFWERLLRDRCLTTSPHTFGFHPRSGRDLILKQFRDAPDMRGESSRHGRGTRMPMMLAGAQLVMRKAKILATADEIHSRLDGLQTMSRTPTFSREPLQACPHCPVELFTAVLVPL